MSGGGVSSVNGMTGNVVLDLDFIPLDGSDSIDGTLSPNRTAVYDLGSSSYKWRYVYGTYLNIDSLAVVKGGLKISGGSSVNCTFYVSGNKLHCYPEIVFDNNTFFSGNYGDLSNKPDLSVYATKASLAAVATSGAYSDLSGRPDLSVYVTTSLIGSAAYLDAEDIASAEQGDKADSALQGIKLNGTELTPSSNVVNVNACTSIETPTGLTAASITSAGLIKLSLTNGYTIPTSGNVAQITTNANAITALQGYFTSGVAKSAAKLNCGDVGSAALPVYFDDGVPKACTLNLSNYVDLTSPQNIPGVKTFVNGLDITGGVSDRTIYKDSNNCLHVTIPIVCDSFISAYGAGSSANVIDEMWTALAASGISHKIHADHLPYDIPPEFVAGVDDDYTGESYADVETMMIAVFERLYNLESALGL